METVIQVLIMIAAAGICLAAGDLQISCVVLAVCMFLEFVVSVLFRRLQERRIAELTKYLMKVQDNLELPELSRHNEGQLGILQSEIYKLVVFLSERSRNSAQEREYLAQMLSDISHQIKTPLTSITIMTDLLKEPELPEEKRVEFTEKIDQSVSRITWLIKNLLTLSQLEADMLKLKKEKVKVRELLEKACQPFELMAEVKEITLDVTADEAISLTCDCQWTAEAISNIVKNCLEHTPSGGEIHIYADQNNFATNIRITDNGEGISKEHLPHIFERFYKADNASSNSVGIGLAMSRQLILQQNGTIHVESELGKGTSFYIKIYSEVQI